jgi:hypothetical protein
MKSAESLPEPDVIRRTAQEVIQRPDYRLDPVPEGGRTILDWALQLLGWIIKPFQWLFHAMEGMPDFLRWIIVIGLFVVLVALVAHIIYSIVAAVRGPRRQAVFDADSLHTAPDPETLERRAQQAVQNGDYISAIRLLFRACLLRLEPLEKQKFRPGMTNREHLRRYRATRLFDPMNRFVQTIDIKWYGGQQCGEQDYALCRDAHAAIYQFTKDRTHAVGA